MKKIGLFYGTTATKTTQIGKKIEEGLGKENVQIVSVEEAWTDDFEKFDNFIIGTSTWFDGELPTYWDEMRPQMEAINFKGKKVAIYGLGDQKKYPENFADAIGILAATFESAGAEIVGLTPTEGYKFEKSEAQRDDKFLGLVLDFENQSDKTKERVASWVKQLKEEFH